jgi:hypothetical protein
MHEDRQKETAGQPLPSVMSPDVVIFFKVRKGYLPVGCVKRSDLAK